MKILCVGQNYAKHVRELGSTPPESPVWFWKPDTAIVTDGQPIELPQGIGAIHYEAELAVRIRREIRRLDPAAAMKHIDAVTVANDVTARDMQNAAKKAGRPWDQPKGYDTFLPLGAWKPLPADLQALQLRCSVNGKVHQDGNTRDMTWNVGQLLAAASQWTTLKPGDILLTGTPDGVGPISPGDQVTAEIVGLAKVTNPVVAQAE